MSNKNINPVSSSNRRSKHLHIERSTPLAITLVPVITDLSVHDVLTLNLLTIICLVIFHNKIILIHVNIPDHAITHLQLLN